MGAALGASRATTSGAINLGLHDQRSGCFAMMRLVFALMAIAVSVTLVGFIGLRDEKRLRSQEGHEAARNALTPRQRQLLAFGAVVPGLLLMIGGWWSS